MLLGTHDLIGSALIANATPDRDHASRYCMAWANKLLDDNTTATIMSCARCWVPYMDPANLLQLLSRYLTLLQSRGSPIQFAKINLVEAVFQALVAWLNDKDILNKFLSFLAPLLQLSQSLQLKSLEEVLEAALSRITPVCISGTRDSKHTTQVYDPTERIAVGMILPTEVLLDAWLQNSDWTEARDRFIGHGLYLSQQLRTHYAKWLTSGSRLETPGKKMIFSFHAFVDTSLSSNQSFLDSNQLREYLLWLLRLYCSTDPLEQDYSVYFSCCYALFGLLGRTPSLSPEPFINMLKNFSLRDLRAIEFLLRGLRALTSTQLHEWERVVIVIVQQAISSLTRRYSEKSDVNDYPNLHIDLSE
jgi:hypothetical protein